MLIIKIVNIVNEFNELLLKQNKEEIFQEFIKKNPLLLAKYHAKNIFIKPNILGKFEPDFVILDSRNHLKLIELEKPSMKLFKKDRQPRQELMHAFGQVVDWLDEYKRNPDAFLECLELNRNQITTVSGVVLAGNSKNEDFKNLQRFYSRPTYSDIELITIDELSSSLLEISKKLL
jgi:Shedu protein SduA, C-terminal